MFFGWLYSGKGRHHTRYWQDEETGMGASVKGYNVVTGTVFTLS